MVEHMLCKHEVTGSIPVASTIRMQMEFWWSNVSLESEHVESQLTFQFVSGV